MAKNDSKTRAFTTTAKPKSKGKVKGKKSAKNKAIRRQRLVISIFVIVALILVLFAALIIGKIISTGTQPEVPPQAQIHTVPREATALHMGNLLLINDSFKYELPADLSDMINIYQYQKNNENAQFTQINGKLTYTLTYDTIYLNKATLDAFNQMVLDYCNSDGYTASNSKFASNLEIAWGGYAESTRNEYPDDVTNIGKDFYDHALGTTMTLKINSPSTVITESILKQSFNWIYQNAHKYGFIIRYPDSCSQHTQIEANKRVHLRYIGVEHATYIFENNICLEEYLDLIRTQYTYGNPLVVNSADGKIYNVYYVELSGNPTSVPVPKDENYYISGDNMNGFIVTVEK